MRWLWLAAALLVAVAGIPGAQAEPVRRLGNFLTAPAPYDSRRYFSYGTRVGDQLFFAGTSYSPEGVQLWKSDGSAAGTVLVRQIPETYLYCDASLASIGSTLYFAAGGERFGIKLWRSDGTPAGTRMVEDGAPATSASSPRLLTNAGGTLFFGAMDAKGPGLWKSDGTAPGTVRVASVPVGNEMVAVGSAVYFTGDDPLHGAELWRSDGTAAGTRVLDLVPGPAGSSPRTLFAFGDAVYFVTGDGIEAKLWKSRGLADTSVVKALSLTWPVNAGPVFYFAAGPGNTQLWKSDGTEPGTVMIVDLPNPYREAPLHHLVFTGSRLYFSRNDTFYSAATLWSSDGTAEGTQNLNVPVQERFAVGWQGLYFGSWYHATRSDGSVAGTFRLPMETGHNPCYGLRMVEVAAAERAVIGLAMDVYGTDGSVSGTKVIGPPPADQGSIGTRGYVGLGARTVFQVTTDASPFSCAAMSTDGTTSGTSLLQQLPSGECYAHWRAFGDGAAGLTGGHPTKLSISHGGAFEQIAEFDRFDSVNSELALVGGRLLFAAAKGGQRQLWISDGTAVGTVAIEPFPKNRLVTKECGDRALLWDGESVWRSDGTPEGTVEVAAVPTYGPMTGNGDCAFYFNVTESSGPALWKSDGTVAGTGRLRVFPGLKLSTTIANYRGAAFFGTGGAQGVTLWKTDGTETGTVAVRSFDGVAPAYDAPAAFTVAGDRLFFNACTNQFGCELWAADGSAGGTHVLDLLPGLESSTPTDLYDAGGFLLFSAVHQIAGREPWRSDGTTHGTRLIADIATGPLGSRPRTFYRVRDRVLFIADDGTTGDEPWAMDLPAPHPTRFHVLKPCRAVDTRDGAPLAAGELRALPLAGTCGIPATAAAVAVNATVVGPESAGDLQLFSSSETAVDSSVLSFRARVVRASHTILRLGLDGAAGARLQMPSGTAHLLIDVSGYFE